MKLGEIKPGEYFTRCEGRHLCRRMSNEEAKEKNGYYADAGESGFYFEYVDGIANSEDIYDSYPGTSLDGFVGRGIKYLPDYENKRTVEKEIKG